MIKLIIFISTIFSLRIFCQEFTIGGVKGSSVFIGLENRIEFKPIKGKIVNKIIAPASVNILQLDGKFFLQVYKANDSFWLMLYSNNELYRLRLKIVQSNKCRC